MYGFDVHVIVHRDKFLIIKPTICTNFSNLLMKWNSTCFRQFLCPSLGAFHCTHSNGIHRTSLRTASSRIRMDLRSILILSETRTVSFQNKIEKLVHLVGFIIRNRPFCCLFLNIQMFVRFVQFLRRWYADVSLDRYYRSCTSLETQLDERFAQLVDDSWSCVNCFYHGVTGDDCVGNVACIGETINMCKTAIGKADS